MRDLWERAERAFSLCFDGLSIGIRIAIGYRTGFLYGAEAGDVARGVEIYKDHLYGARLRLHKKLNSKSCSSRDSPPTVVLADFYFRPRSHSGSVAMAWRLSVLGGAPTRNGTP